MRIPRDLSGRDLGRRLGRVGYQFARQAGSHMRFTREEQPIHSVTIPDHKDLRAGTLRQILNDVSGKLDMSPDELMRKLLE